MSKMIFIKYLTPVRPKLVQKLKYSEFIESWHIRYFKYANLDFDVKRVFYIKYLPITRRQLVPKWKITLTNFIKFRTHFIHSNTPSFLVQIFAYPVLDLSPSKTMFCFKKLQTFLLLSSSFFLFFFFNFVLHLHTSQFCYRCLTLAKVSLLRLSLSTVYLVLSFFYHLASQLRKFWVKCHFCFVYALLFMLYSRKGERHTKKIHCKCLWKKRVRIPDT